MLGSPHCRNSINTNRNNEHARIPNSGQTHKGKYLQIIPSLPNTFRRHRDLQMECRCCTPGSSQSTCCAAGNTFPSLTKWSTNRQAGVCSCTLETWPNGISAAEDVSHMDGRPASRRSCCYRLSWSICLWHFM